MKKLIIPFLAVAVVFIAGCFWQGIRGDGNITTDQRTVPAFSTINATGGFDIHWSAGQPAVVIMTDSNLLSHIKSEVTDDTLHIYSDTRITPSHGIQVTLTGGTLTGVRLTGDIQFNAAQLSGKSLKIESTGAADIHVDGVVDDLNASLTGACKLSAASLKTKTTEIKLVGASDAEIAVSDALKASIVGAGSLKYAGEPKMIEQKVTGAGSIKHLN
jgi:hypothetical protein